MSTLSRPCCRIVHRTLFAIAFTAPIPYPVPVSPHALDVIICDSPDCTSCVYRDWQSEGIRLREIMGDESSVSFSVEGTTMANAGLYHGDIVICNYDKRPKVGSSVVVRLGNNDYTCKIWEGESMPPVENTVLKEIAPDRDWSFVAVIEAVIRTHKRVLSEHQRMREIEQENQRLKNEMEMLRTQMTFRREYAEKN